MALFYQPSNPWGGGGGWGSYPIPGQTYLLPWVGPNIPNQTGGTPLNGNTYIGNQLAGPTTGEVAEIWGHGTLFIGGDVINTGLDISGDFGQTVQKLASSPLFLFLIMASLSWWFVWRKKR